MDGVDSFRARHGPAGRRQARSAKGLASNRIAADACWADKLWRRRGRYFQCGALDDTRRYDRHVDQSRGHYTRRRDSSGQSCTGAQYQHYRAAITEFIAIRPGLYGWGLVSLFNAPPSSLIKDPTGYSRIGISG